MRYLLYLLKISVLYLFEFLRVFLIFFFVIVVIGFIIRKIAPYFGDRHSDMIIMEVVLGMMITGLWYRWKLRKSGWLRFISRDR